MEILEEEDTESICVEIDHYFEIKKTDILSFFRG